MIKAIATDKDGTLFKSDNTMDEDYFDRIYQQLTDHNIKFIVASGNQLAQLQSFFPNKKDDISYVAENGAITVDNGEIMTAHYFPENTVTSLLEMITEDFGIKDVVLSALNCAYILDDRADDFYDYVDQYYYYKERVSDLQDVEDTKIVKIALRVKDASMVDKIVEIIEDDYDEVRAVTSGNDSIDLILTEVNKGHALEELLEKWGIQADELMTFGDADNDLEMLKMTPHSYAMAECSDNVAQAAQHRAPSNDDSGVFQVIEDYLEQQK
ncbi:MULTISPECIES: Cof-type HAD-IIB family hydrolase [Staphylococcus]|uniref:HAD family hydrolase n=1 Tax=Staphylococcus pettenkoferi TaxID=170573 RepID=A0A1Z3U187_9STAP|nr:MULTISPECIES: Cof-type HAD-IIB family hydrolase [Staphylococcus]ASE37025.1 HAD family hydrolase [Staphylococcus pettenkoferi]EHM71497.1 Cof-like hydrolase [Staphylococcus pettenkoferi VCU012]MBX8993779.1 HAD family hydrolase [Staphylococcus pettenkoferi]MCI2792104.1 Cof-type HAD-IIB family hydrolase [Staphylococcus pettenkoferi]MCY1581460.1 Cof-type HAD-IIB family hydrolase [Staphylococcus pettenkoferi]